MTGAADETDNSDPGDEPEVELGVSVACKEARTGIAEFLGQAGSASRAAGKDDGGSGAEGFRTHIVGCSECMLLYREAVASAARLGESIRVDLADRRRRRIHSGMRQRSREATGDNRRKNRFGLRLALLPAGVALLIVLMRGRGPSEELYIRWTGGEVVVAGQLMGADRPEFRLEPGDWCETRGNALASLVTSQGGDEQRFGLGATTVILVEDPAASRIRLARGELDVSGPGVVLTPHGVLEIEGGRAHLRLRGGTYDLDCLEGRLVWTGPTGSRELSAGASIESGSILADAN